MIKNNDFDCECEFKNGTHPFVNEVEMETGEIVFVNYFDDRTEDGQEIFEPENKYSDEFSLNTYIGRRNLARHYANKFNIMYGQMGNMSIGIFANKNNSEVYITRPYLFDYGDDEDDEQNNIASLKNCFNDNGVTERGSISLSMWRWMAADMATIRKYNIRVKGLETECESGYSCHEESVVINGEKGKWKVTHNYDVDGYNGNPYIYAIIEKS
jgi:hypothetical protein